MASEAVKRRDNLSNDNDTFLSISQERKWGRGKQNEGRGYFRSQPWASYGIDAGECGHFNREYRVECFSGYMKACQIKCKLGDLISVPVSIASRPATTAFKVGNQGSSRT